MTAVLVLRDEAEVTGVRLRLAKDGKVKVGGGAPPELLARLGEHKAELLELLSGRLCRHCGERDPRLAPGVARVRRSLGRAPRLP